MSENLRSGFGSVRFAPHSYHRTSRFVSFSVSSCPAVWKATYFAGSRFMRCGRGKCDSVYLSLRSQLSLTRDVVQPHVGISVSGQSGHLSHPANHHGDSDPIFFSGDSALHNGLYCIGKPVVRGSGLRLHSIMVSFKVSLYLVSRSVVSLPACRILRGGRSLNTSLPGCTFHRKRTFLSKSTFSLLCAPTCL